MICIVTSNKSLAVVYYTFYIYFRKSYSTEFNQCVVSADIFAYFTLGATSIQQITIKQ